MKKPRYTVTVTIKDCPGGKASIETKIDPEPNPAHASNAVLTWLVMRQAITAAIPSPKKARHAKKTR